MPTGVYKRKPFTLTDEKHPGWKGDDVGYQALHTWIRKKLGSPKVCSMCNTTSSKKYEWANKSKTYSRNLKDWIRLCTKCHRIFDDSLPKGAEHCCSKLTDANIVKIISLYSTGSVTQQQIAAMFKVKQSTIGAILHKRTWKHLKINTKIVFRVKNNKLTIGQRQDIKDLYLSNKLSQKQLAKMFNVHQTTIHYVLKKLKKGNICHLS